MDLPPSPLAPHPIRLVVTDDLSRSRLTVLFRLLLVLPHLAWILLWSAAVLPVGFVVWLAVLFERRAPRTLHEFLSSYVRYQAHVLAYLYLGANPYPGFTGQPGYPVDVEIDPPARQRRWRAGFRLLLALPALLLATTLVGGGGGGGFGGAASFSAGAAATAAFLGWFAALALGRMPGGLRDLVAYAVGYGAQAYGYALLLTDRYPSADPALLQPAPRLPSHPVRIVVTDTLERSRLTVLFRALLAVPHVVWLLLWTVAAALAAFAAWVVALVLGRVPVPLHRFLAAYVRYGSHLWSFLYVVGGPFPGFAGTAGSYPLDVEIDPPLRQRRLVTAFRLVLWVPAVVLGGAYGSVLFVIAVFGWLASLFTGRMPGGLRQLGAAGIRYLAQTYAYVLLLTDRYPYASPVLVGAPADEQLVLGVTEDAA